MSTLRPWRDLLVQVMATVMIPLTVAGTGLYYTRWQQNVSDLKTMIDLVSDANAEKRKFGVAMLEYLLKNDKVPVEFVAAQLDYANSSADKQMLPLMESALMKAADENPAVAETFRKALEVWPALLVSLAVGPAGLSPRAQEERTDVDRRRVAPVGHGDAGGDGCRVVEGRRRRRGRG